MKKSVKKIGVALLLCGLAMAGLAATVVKDEVPVAQDSKPIVVRTIEPVFEIKLAADPSTGYRWMLAGSYNPLLLMPVSAKYFPSNKKLPGSGGYVVWRFRVKAGAFLVPRVMRVNLVYARPWDMKDAQKREFVIVTE